MFLIVKPERDRHSEEEEEEERKEEERETVTRRAKRAEPLDTVRSFSFVLSHRWLSERPRIRASIECTHDGRVEVEPRVSR